MNVPNRSAINRNGWGSGPWDSEPDTESFITKVGYRGELRRTSLGTWCGYVGLPANHPFVGRPWEDIEADIDVHGGVTFAGCGLLTLIHDVHTQAAEWVGFDTAHGSDYVPGFAAPENGGFTIGEPYRTQAYVRAEVERLAAQLFLHDIQAVATNLLNALMGDR